MKLFRAGILLLSVLFVPSGSWCSTVPDCPPTFAKIGANSSSIHAHHVVNKNQFRLPVNSSIPIPQEILDSITTRSRVQTENIQMIKGVSVPFSPGGKLGIVETLDGNWESEFRQNGRDVLSSPLLFPFILNGKVGSFFGYRLIDKDYVSVPNAEALTAVTRVLNVKLREPISFRFFETSTTRPMSGEQYIERFLNGEIPIEKDGALGLHDRNLHSFTILYPEWYTSRMKSNARLSLQFAKYLMNLGDPNSVATAKVIINFTVVHLDELGAIGLKLREAQNSKNPRKWGTITFESLIKSTHGEMSPVEHLQDYANPAQVEQFLNTTFSAKERTSFERETLSSPDDIEKTAEKLYDGVIHRIDEIRSVVDAV